MFGLMQFQCNQKVRLEEVMGTIRASKVVNVTQAGQLAVCAAFVQGPTL